MKTTLSSPAARSFRRGFTLAEVIFSMAILFLGLMGVHSLLVQTLEAQKRMSRRSAAYSLAQEKAADYQLEGYQRLASRLDGNGADGMILIEGGVTENEPHLLPSGSLEYRVEIGYDRIRPVDAADDELRPVRIDTLAWPVREDFGSTKSLSRRVTAYVFPDLEAVPLSEFRSDLETARELQPPRPEEAPESEEAPEDQAAPAEDEEAEQVAPPSEQEGAE